MSLKRSQWLQLQKQRKRFMEIMEMTLTNINSMRKAKLQNILRQCPTSQCADEAMVSYKEVNHEVDRFLDRMSHQIHDCVQTQKQINPAGVVDCFSKFEYIIRYEMSKIKLQ